LIDAVWVGIGGTGEAGALRFEIGERRFRRAAEAVRDERGLAAGFVGIEAVVADASRGWANEM